MMQAQDAYNGTERLDRLADVLSRLLRLTLTIGVALSCLLFFSYCIRIGFIPTDLEISQLLTGLFLLFAFGLAYLVAAFFMHLVGTPLALLPIAWFMERKFQGTKLSKRPRWYLRLVSQHRQERGADLYFSWVASAIALGAVLYLSIVRVINTNFLLRLLFFSAVLSFLVHSLFFVYRRSLRYPKRSSFPAKRIFGREVVPIIAIGLTLPLFALGAYAGVAVDLTMEAARLRLQHATVRIPANVIEMLPTDTKLTGEVRQLNDGSIVVDDVLIYLHRIGSEAFLGLPVERTEDDGTKVRRILRTTVANSSLSVLDFSKD